MTARYLLRFDDLSPTMDRARWQRFGRWVWELGLKPILAVVPDNRDPELEICPPDPEFWPWLRSLESSGAAIALHGLHHQCESPHGGLLPLHRETEFAGLDQPRQRAMMREGLQILRSHGIDPRLFVPPRHGFDRATLAALHAEGLPVLSDGFSSRAFRQDGVVCIPQQIWAPVEKPSGLWTLCIHTQTATDAQVAELEHFARAHRPQFTSVDEILQDGAISALGPLELAAALARFTRVRLSKARKRLYLDASRASSIR